MGCGHPEKRKCEFSRHMKRWTYFVFLFKGIQCPLGFATLDKAAALALATATPLTYLRQYINSNLGYSNLKFLHLYTEIATVKAFGGR